MRYMATFCKIIRSILSLQIELFISVFFFLVSVLANTVEFVRIVGGGQCKNRFWDPVLCLLLLCGSYSLGPGRESKQLSYLVLRLECMELYLHSNVFVHVRCECLWDDS